MIKNNVVLIGMPGSGKSTCGVVLAKALGYSFEDTDLLISKKAGKRLQSILDNDGVAEFLRLEEEIGSSVECDGSVIATGGSMVMSEKAMIHLKEIATVVYISVPIDELLHRIKNFKTRGIVFEHGETFEDLFNERTPLYQKYADITVEFKDDNLETTVEKIKRLLEE